jgi:L-alanine-DL-glutamate epimerase-like enolase superfamily enzyme
VEKKVAEANSGWLRHEALKFIRAVRNVVILIEHPRQSCEECLSICKNTENALILDEVIERIPQLLRALNKLAMDVPNIKISKYGYLPKAHPRNSCSPAKILRTTALNP